MVNKCCIPNCNIDSDNKENEYVPIYRLPKSEEEKNLWLKAIPRTNIKDLKNPVICRKHWPLNAEYIDVQGGYKRPKYPPTIFETIPKSCIPTLPKRRSTSKCLSDIRSIEKDQYEEFKMRDSLFFESIMEFIQINHQNLLV